MPDISSIGHGSVGPLHRSSPPDSSHRNGVSSPSDRSAAPGDRVELSEHAQYLDRLRRMSAIRADLVEQVRQEIANGTYDTQERLDRALEKLVRDIEP